MGLIIQQRDTTAEIVDSNTGSLNSRSHSARLLELINRSINECRCLSFRLKSMPFPCLGLKRKISTKTGIIVLFLDNK